MLTYCAFMTGSHVSFHSCSRFLCSCNDERPLETSVTEGPGKVLSGQLNTSTNSQGGCDNYISCGAIWKGHFHLLKGLWVGFLLALVEKWFGERVADIKERL